MNGSQNQQTTGGSDLSSTQNPQTIPIQNLGAPTTSLQNSDSALTDSRISITSVGSSKFLPVTVQTTSITKLAPTSSSSATPLAAGLILGSIVLAALLLWAGKKEQSEPAS